MKEHPILFSTDMVKAILEGRKTQTRRVVKAINEVGKNKKEPSDKAVGFIPSADPECFIEQFPLDLTLMYPQSKPTTMNGGSYRCPYGQVGSKLWVRETFTTIKTRDNRRFYLYKAGLPPKEELSTENLRSIKWMPSIFMPHEASRITLEITDIRVQRLQEITEKDAIAEGIPAFAPNGIIRNYKIPQMQYEVLWDKINGKKYSWSDNPFVWVISFKRV